ncbi:MAG: GNAT family N-acetyltransferase [Chloroflexi bacterium]|nr:GNAT family N-acetyltransferase [Chloroflexota bacterium]
MTQGATAVLTTLTSGGQQLALRYMTAADRDALLRFARSLPTHDLLFLRRDITKGDEIDAWIADIQRGEVSTILAVDEANAVVGYAAVARNDLRWMRHVAELRVLVGEEARGAGVGRALTQEAFRVAADTGVRKMIARMTLDQPAAIHVFRRLGFRSVALLPDHVVDPSGRSYDMVVMEQDVASYEATLQELDQGRRAS